VNAERPAPVDFANLLHRIKVVNDESMMKDELLAWACFRLDRLGEGVRMMHLYDAESKPCKGKIMVRVEKSFVLNK